jgi:hypothetical protein
MTTTIQSAGGNEATADTFKPGECCAEAPALIQRVNGESPPAENTMSGGVSAARFLASMEPDLNTGCWLWALSVTRKGYGKVTTKGRKKVRAHRLSWTIFRGEIPDGALVCHHCDTPSCVNPEHLFLGTPKSNMDDMIAKGRKRVSAGEAQPNAKLTVALVAEIRALYRSGLIGQRTLARRFGVSRSTAQRVVTNTGWSA